MSEKTNKKVLIAVDLQQGFVQTPQTRTVRDRVLSLIDSHRFDYVIGTQFVNPEKSMYERLIDWPDMRTEQETAICPELLERFDWVVEKHCYTCVSNEFLAHLIRINGGEYPKEIYLAGLDTEACVLKIAVDLFEHEVKPIVITDCCYSYYGEKFHQAGLLTLQIIIGSRQLINADELVF